MRWTIAKKPFLLLRRTTTTSARPSADPSISDELALTEEIHTILDTFPPTAIESPLDSLAPFLSPHIVSAVLHDTPLLSAFRFFVWASRRPHLRSWPAHNRIISLLQSHNNDNFSSAWETLADLKSQSLPIPPPAFTVLISAYAAADVPEKAVEAFARMMPEFGCRPNTFTYNTVLQIMVDRGFVILAMAVYSRMLKLDCRPNRATYSILLDGLSKAGEMKDVSQLSDEMLWRGITPNTTTYTVLISSHCKSNDFDEASSLLNQMKQNNCRLDSVTHNVMISGFCKSGRVREALEHLTLFREDGYVLGLRGYSCLIDGLFRVGRFEEACKYYREMLEKNVAPDCVMYTIMIKGYFKAGKIDGAVLFLGKMIQHGLVPDTFCYNTLIKGFCDAGLLDRARDLEWEILRNDRFPDSATYTIMIGALCKEGLIHEAQQIFDEMEKLGCFRTVMTFNALINGLCKAGKLEEARFLFTRMKEGNKPSLFLRLSLGANQARDSNSLRKLVEELCESGLVDKAYKLLRDIIESGVVPDVVTYNILINGFCKVGDLNGALKLFEELQCKGKELQCKEHSPDAVTYGTLIDGLLKVHREDEAVKLLQIMERNGCTPSISIYNILMKALCRKKKVSQVVTFWLDHISRERRLSREAETIRVVRRHFEQGNLEKAVRDLVEMDRERGSLSSFPYAIWLNGYCQAGKFDEALSIFSILTEYNIDATPPSCVLLINYLCWQRKLASALDVMLYALRKGFIFDIPVGNRLIKGLCMTNKKDALELACRMRLAGYDMDMYLRASTKALLYNHHADAS